MSTVNTLFERTIGKKIAEIIWTIILIIIVGLFMSIIWAVLGIVFSITIIGLPLGKKCFSIAGYAFSPANKTITYTKGEHKLFNFLWIPFGLVLFIITFVLVGVVSPFILFFPNIKKYYKLLKMCFVPLSVTITKNLPNTK